jgi:ABC-2 type transport system ATP-binding protein
VQAPRLRVFALNGRGGACTTNKYQELIVEVSDLRHTYGDRVALDGVSLSVAEGEIFALLGPNGSGKTTLFRILSTLVPAPPGTVRVAGHDPATDRDAVRRNIGVVFQSPSLDKQLTAAENLTHQGHLYGLSGADLRRRVDGALAAVGLSDRAGERADRLSGGMRRRVEIAKGLLHRPRVLLMDEPSTGLDPAARLDLWDHLRQVSRGGGAGGGVTILITTHIVEEAEDASRVAILQGGKLLACDTPAALKERIGGDVITVTSTRPEAVRDALRQRLGAESELVEGLVRLERTRGAAFIPQLIEAAPGLVDSVSVGKPTLQDVFIRLTGRRFKTEVEPTAAREAPRKRGG